MADQMTRLENSFWVKLEASTSPSRLKDMIKETLEFASQHRRFRLRFEDLPKMSCCFVAMEFSKQTLFRVEAKGNGNMKCYIQWSVWKWDTAVELAFRNYFEPLVGREAITDLFPVHQFIESGAIDSETMIGWFNTAFEAA